MSDFREVTAADLVGAWKLIGYDRVDGAGIRRPAAPLFSGAVVFEPGGYVAVVIERGPTGAPQATTIAYAARYSLHRGRIRNEVIVASVAHWTGTVLEREARFEGERLIFTTIPDASGFFELVWERISSPTTPRGDGSTSTH